jgi:hypothetical protein
MNKKYRFLSMDNQNTSFVFMKEKLLQFLDVGKSDNFYAGTYTQIKKKRQQAIQENNIEKRLKIDINEYLLDYKTGKYLIQNIQYLYISST